MKSKKNQGFLSYSHADKNLVTKLFQLLKINGSVFLDRVSLNPGDLWQEQIEEAIKNCTVFILCWCHHAHKSNEVEKEYKLALRLDKKIVPLILDENFISLPTELKKFQYIDFSKEINHTKGTYHPHEELGDSLPERLQIADDLKTLDEKLIKITNFSELCPTCLHYGPWNGVICLNCGRRSYPND